MSAAARELGPKMAALWPRLVGYARRFLVEADHTDWEDAASAAVEAALRKPETIGTSLEGWLLQATRWAALTLRDRRRREAGHRADPATAEGPRRAQVDAGSASHVTAITVREAVAELPPVLRTHAAARLTGRSLREVGEYLGHTKATAYHHELALKRALRARLAGQPIGVVRLAVTPRASGRSCVYEDCGGPEVARGRCKRHYLRWWRARAAGGVTP